MTDETRPQSSMLSAWLAGGLFVVIALQVWSAWLTRSAIDELTDREVELAQVEAAAARAETAAIRIDGVSQDLSRIEERIIALSALGDDFVFLTDEVIRVRDRVNDLVETMEGRGEFGIDEIEQPPELDWTQPALFEAAKRAAAEFGIELTEDEVRVPAEFLLYQGTMEYLAVLKGGKEHESLVGLVGNTPADEKRPVGFGAALNNAIQALGFQRGTPIRFSAGGTIPARGQTIYLFIEWEEDGIPVVVRAEDLVWDRMNERPMPRDSWVYVGSSWVEGMDEGELEFAADITAEAVSTYSARNTIVDTIAPGAQDDTVFLVATPRVPEGVREATFIFRAKDREPTRTFPDPFGDPIGDDPEEDSGGE